MGWVEAKLACLVSSPLSPLGSGALGSSELELLGTCLGWFGGWLLSQAAKGAGDPARSPWRELIFVFFALPFSVGWLVGAWFGQPSRLRC